MTTIREEDFIQSVADAFQFISFYHPADYIRDLHAAYQREESPAAKDAMAQILVNSRMAAEGHRPICQDTGIAIAFIKVGMEVRWDTKKSLEALVNEGVRRAYTDKDNPLRASMLADPDGKRKSTGDNTPAVTHVELVPGNTVEVICAAKLTKLNETVIMLVVLGLIDVVMISNLLIMVIVGGYETFVSRMNLEHHPDQPEWLSSVNASVLKVKLATAIIGISSIHLLKTFINAAQLEVKTMMWQTIIHLTFLVSAIAIAAADRVLGIRYHDEHHA